MEGITLDDSGTPDNPNGPLEIPWSPLPGEPIRLGLMSADGALKLYAKLVPVPLCGEDQGCTVEATLSRRAPS